MKNLILVGAGGHCESCIEVVEQNKEHKIIGILDPYVTEKKKYGYKIFKSDKDLNEIINFVTSTD